MFDHYKLGKQKKSLYHLLFARDLVNVREINLKNQANLFPWFEMSFFLI